MSTGQKLDWDTFYGSAPPPDFKRMWRHPDAWQVLLAERILRIADKGSVLEAGCGTGLTSLLVGTPARRTLLDREPRAIAMARELFKIVPQEAAFVVGDILDLAFPDNCFDAVFNAGVLEHFDFAGRRKALMEMIRVTKPGGRICVAVPNHYSVPYRVAYRHLKARGRWPYPDEAMIRDFSLELAGVPNVEALSRETIDVNTSFFYLSGPEKAWFRLLHRFRKFEGYLAVFMLEKTAGAC